VPCADVSPLLSLLRAAAERAGKRWNLLFHICVRVQRVTCGSGAISSPLFPFAKGKLKSCLSFTACHIWVYCCKASGQNWLVLRLAGEHRKQVPEASVSLLAGMGW
jgi:hypothetical protein